METAENKTPASKSSDTVVVGCKMPNGLILQCSELIDTMEAVPGGFKTVPMARRLPEIYTLRGTAIDLAKLQTGLADLPVLAGGYALTFGIPKDFWERWLKINEDSELVRGGLIFAVGSEPSARSRAAEGAALRSGLEPIDPLNPATIGPDVRRIEVGTRG